VLTKKLKSTKKTAPKAPAKKTGGWARNSGLYTLEVFIVSGLLSRKLVKKS
jgi:hypothetical protein